MKLCPQSVAVLKTRQHNYRHGQDGEGDARWFDALAPAAPQRAAAAGLIPLLPGPPRLSPPPLAGAPRGLAPMDKQHRAVEPFLKRLYRGHPFVGVASLFV